MIRRLPMLFVASPAALTVAVTAVLIASGPLAPEHGFALASTTADGAVIGRRAPLAQLASPAILADACPLALGSGPDVAQTEALIGAN